MLSIVCVSYLLSSAEIRYILTLDALRAKARASFIASDDRRITRNMTIRDRERGCVQETFMMSASTLIFLMHTWGYLWFPACKEILPVTVLLAQHPQERTEYLDELSAFSLLMFIHENNVLGLLYM